MMNNVLFVVLAFVALSLANNGFETNVDEIMQNIQNTERIPKQNVPLDLDCQLRQLALEFSQKLLEGQGYDSVSNALNLDFCSSILDQEKDDEVPFRMKEPKIKEDLDSVTFYVSGTDGNDNWEGSFNYPFQSLERAREEVRRVKYYNTSRLNIYIYVRNGTYYLDQPFALYPPDGGHSEFFQVYYRSYPGEEVIISGGKPLNNLMWKPYRDGIYMAKLPSDTKPFTSLFVNGQRMTRARWPNGNPSIPFSGYTNAASGFPIDETNNGTTINISTPPGTIWDWPTFVTMSGGPVSRYTSFTSPNLPCQVPYGFYYNDSTFTTQKWANPQTGIVHMFHPYLWGNWQFQIESIDYSQSGISLLKGGWQEGRGGPITNNMYYVENIFEELDYPREWFYDTTQHVLYYYPELGQDINSLQFVTPLLKNVIELRGSVDDPIRNLEFSGFTIMHSATTFMDPYEVPSGGDWAIHRGGAIFMEGARDITIKDCYFNQPGGNGIFLSNYAYKNHIKGNEFYSLGDSAVCVVGTSSLIVATENSGHHNIIENNHIHEIGIYGKQTAGYFQAVAHHNIIRHNVIYNGPRAGINFNDGYMGGDVMEGNLVFNMVRETSDHGCFNSWDRLPYVYVKNGWALMTPETHIIRYNYLINWNYLGETFGTRCLDHDDGSSQYLDMENLLIYGAVKFRDGNNRTATGNIIINSEIEAAEFQVLSPNTESVDAFFDNTVINFTPNGLFYECDYLPNRNPVFKTYKNKFYTPMNASLPFTTADSCPGTNIQTLHQWQKEGFDHDSTISSHISTATILSLAKNVLRFN